MKGQIQVDIEVVLQGMAQLNLQELESIAHQVNQLVAQKKAPHLSPKESFLLEQINKGLPQKDQNRYSELLKKSTQEKLTVEEHEEFLSLIPIAEAKQVERLTYLVELAQLRQISLEELMDDLGISPPKDV